MQRGWFALLASLLILQTGLFHVRAAVGDAAQLLSVSIPAGAVVMPRTMFTQTWTFQNTGTNKWSAGQSGYTLNLASTDVLAVVPLTANGDSGWYLPCASLNGGKTVPTNGQGSFSLSFIAPEMSGSYTDIFQLSSAAGVSFGPLVTLQVVVQKAGSTNQFDRARAIAYANEYAGYVVSDGYFWTNGSDFGNFGAHAPVPTAELGDDCAHFVSCCIGNESHERGGGLNIPTRVPPAYGEPAASRIVNNCLIAPGYAVEVSSINQLSPGDVIGWNWEGDTNIADLDHVTLYLGNGVLASHSVSCLDMLPSYFEDGEPDWKWHLIHIYDAPTLNARRSGKNYILSWTTNWSAYSLYSSTNSRTWTKVTTSPHVTGNLNILTNTMSAGGILYRLMMP